MRVFYSAYPNTLALPALCHHHLCSSGITDPQNITMVIPKFFFGLLLASQAIASPALRNHQVQDLSVPELQGRSSSCSATTFSNITGFILTEYLIDTIQVAGNQTQTIATFGVLNPGTGDTYRLHRIPISAGGGTWSVCRAGETPIPSTLERCQVLLERSERSRRLGFRFQWLCDGDPSKPYVSNITFSLVFVPATEQIKTNSGFNVMQAPLRRDCDSELAIRGVHRQGG
jgi:hypothetical protein